MTQGLTYPPTENTPSTESIELLRRKLAESRKVQRVLRKEHARNELLKQQLDAILSASISNSLANASSSSFLPDLSFLTKSHSAHALGLSASSADQQPLTTNTKFAMSQLPALRAALADLRPRLATLQATKQETAKDEQRQERRDYIEQRTKVQLDKIGHTRMEDADAMSGRKIDKDEVEALERAADLFDR